MGGEMGDRWIENLREELEIDHLPKATMARLGDVVMSMDEDGVTIWAVQDLTEQSLTLRDLASGVAIQVCRNYAEQYNLLVRDSMIYRSTKRVY